MARVTKINVGGTNYDIAHEGELKNSGFEVVTALPTTGLFEGRQVVYQNRVWVYSNGWVSPNNPVSFPTGVTLRSSTEDLTAAARYVELHNFQLEQIPELLNKSLFISNNNNCVKQSDRLYELIDNSTGIITVKPDIVQPAVGQTLRYTAINPSYGLDELYYRTRLNGNMYYCAYCIYIPQNKRLGNAIYKIEYYIYTNATGDGDLTNQDNYVWKTVFEKELLQCTEIIYPLGGGLSPLIDIKYIYIYNIRVSITPTNQINNQTIQIFDIDIKYFGLKHQPLIYANLLINYNAAIEPTQTSETFKSIPWILQYLTQGVNWLKANNVRLSAYNTKVAALEQADSDNNANTQSVRTDLTELSNGLATVARSGSYNDLIDKPTFSGSYNDLTDKPTLFSGSYNDLTDKPTLATVATSGSYNDLTDKPTFSGSYNDLTDKPTLATVATSGSYNDLTDKPDLVFSNIGGNVATAQITDGSITNAKLANSSMTLNGINCELGDTKTLPCIISFDGTLYKVRIYQNWLQIYHAGTWVNKYYLLSSLPTECRYITDLSDPSWYDESVTEYELDNSATTQLLLANSSTNIANWIEAINANQITFNSSVISSKNFNKGALDNIISNLKGKGYSVFVENDIDTILNSGNDWVISIKIKRFNDTYKAIIECYVAR